MLSRLASFGELQYGTSFLTTVYYSPEQSVRHACNETLLLRDDGLRKVIDTKDQSMGVMAYVEDGGNCTTITKVRNM